MTGKGHGRQGKAAQRQRQGKGNGNGNGKAKGTAKARAQARQGRRAGTMCRSAMVAGAPSAGFSAARRPGRNKRKWAGPQRRAPALNRAYFRWRAALNSTGHVFFSPKPAASVGWLLPERKLTIPKRAAGRQISVYVSLEMSSSNAVGQAWKEWQ